MTRPVRIVYVTDLHGAIDRLELLLELTKASIYIIAGDLLYNPFADIRDMQLFDEVQRQVRTWYPQDGIALPLKLRADLDNLDAARRAVAITYLKLAEKAHKSMLRKYRALERLTVLKPRTPVYFLPGNYDLDLSETALASLNLHRRVVRTPAGKIGGYGGAPVFTPGIPQHLAVRYHEQRQGPGARSEPYEVLKALDPDIAVTHMPPLGILDGSPRRAFGSWGVFDFLDESQRLKALLVGHVHDAWGVKLWGNAWVINPGNFGAQVAPSGYHRGGYFAEIALDPFQGVQSVIMKRLERTKIWHLTEYRRQPGQNRIALEIIEPKRHRARQSGDLTQIREEAAGTNKDFDVSELAAYNQIKLFMRRFETAESEARIDDIRELVAKARERGTEIAFDILGSLNMGQSSAESDVDAVLYIADDPANNRYDPLFFPTLIREVIQDRYKLDLSDLIDLWEVRDAIAANDASNEALQRFVIYRTIGRPVNVRTLRKYDDLLLSKPELRRRIQNLLRDDLRQLIGTSSHSRSFEKYLARMREAGVRLPPHVLRRIHRYLHTVDPG